MATSSDELLTFDKLCMPCKDSFNTKQADFCCNDCGLLMCDSCVINHQKLFSTHEEIGREDISKWLTGNQADKKRCPLHGEKLLLKCIDHDEACCSTCVLVDHRFCGRVTENNHCVIPDTGSHLYSTKAFHSVDIGSSDPRTPIIYGCCQVDNGNMILADYGNDTLKELNSQYSVISSVAVTSGPQDVTHVRGNEVAFTAKGDECHEIQFASANRGHLSLSRKFIVDHVCYGLDCYKNELFVCSDTTVYLYDMTGRRLRTVFHDKSSNEQRHTIAVSKCGSKLFILRQDDCELVTIDPCGKELARLKFKDNNDLYGICIANDGSVIVCADQAILQVDRYGKQILGILAWKSHEVDDARSVCLNKKQDELIVGRFSDNIAVLKIK